jgi:hypothetical protein
MSKRKNRHERLPQFVPLFYETLKSPAYRHLSHGAWALFTALRMRCFKNNGHVYLSLRDAGEELGHKDRSDIANWYRELQQYGFLVQTEAASLGVNGRGKAPHWRFTDMPARNANGELDSPTKEFLRWDGVLFKPHIAPSNRWNARKQTTLKKQNPGLHVATTVDSTSIPLVDSTSLPLGPLGGSNGESIRTATTGSNVESITRLATGVARAGTTGTGKRAMPAAGD